MTGGKIFSPSRSGFFASGRILAPLLTSFSAPHYTTLCSGGDYDRDHRGDGNSVADFDEALDHHHDPRCGVSRGCLLPHRVPPGTSLDPGGTSPHRHPFKADSNVTSDTLKFAPGGEISIGLVMRADWVVRERTRRATGSQVNLHLMEVLSCKAIIDPPEL